MNTWIIGIVLVLIFAALKLRKKPKTVREIIIYPIKSCAPIYLNSVEINEYGMLYDRHWVLLHPDNSIVTQRDNSHLLKLRPFLQFKNNKISQVKLVFDDLTFVFEPRKVGEVIDFTCMSAPCEGLDEGPEVASFLKSAFKKDYRMVSVMNHRQINHHPRYQGVVSDEHHTNFTDAAQFLVISEESFRKINESLPGSKKNSLDIGAFRGNIIVSGCYPFEEDTWAHFAIGNVEFQGFARCGRCKVTTVNQKTLEYDEEFDPVNTLRKINGNGTKGYLGMHCLRLNNGEIRVGQPVVVKQTRKFPDI